MPLSSGWLWILLLALCLFALFARLGSSADVTLAWDIPAAGAEGAVASRLYQRQAGECVLNAAQYTQLGPDLPLPTTQVTVTALSEGAGYCWLVRFVDANGNVGLPSYVIGLTVPRPPAPPPQHLRIPGTP